MMLEKSEADEYLHRLGRRRGPLTSDRQRARQSATSVGCSLPLPLWVQGSLRAYVDKSMVSVPFRYFRVLYPPPDSTTRPPFLYTSYPHCKPSSLRFMLPAATPPGVWLLLPVAL